MKNISRKIILSLFILGAFIVFNACNKQTDSNIAPTIQLKTGPGYTSDSTSTIGPATAIKVGIVASESGSEDYLNTITVSHAFDGNAPIQDSTRVLSQNEHRTFEEDVNFTTRSNPGTEVYYFTVTNQNGKLATTSVSFTVR